MRCFTCSSEGAAQLVRIGHQAPFPNITTFSSGRGNSSTARSSRGRPSLVNMNGINTASKFRMPASIAVTDPLIQSLKNPILSRANLCDMRLIAGDPRGGSSALG